MRVANALVLFSVFFGAVLLLQWHSGALRSDFGGHPDEAAHYVTGLMVHDYIEHMGTSPTQFAETYYLHYPKVAIGHWPPVFYILQAVWIFLFAASRASMMVLMASIMASVALLVYAAARELGKPIGVFSALLILALPVSQSQTQMVMAELPLTLFCLAAALLFARYLESRQLRHAVGFGIMASLAILTKGNGLALVLVPGLTVLLTRRWDVLGEWKFWTPAAIVLVVCGPWYWLTRHMQDGSWVQPYTSWSYTAGAMRFFSRNIITAAGGCIAILVAIGFLAGVLVPCWKSGASAKWAALSALVLSVCLIPCVLPVGYEARYLVAGLPAWCILAGAGIHWALNRGALVRLRPAAVLLAGVLFMVQAFAIPKSRWSGFSEVERILVGVTAGQPGAWLVASDPRGEGMLIAATAFDDHRPGQVVLRGSKVLADSNWYGYEFRALYHTPIELMTYLRSVPVRFVVIDHSAPDIAKTGYTTLLQQSIAAYPNSWQRVGDFPAVRAGVVFPSGISVYRFLEPGFDPASGVRIDMHRMLNEVLQLPPGGNPK